ncbi:hypothetical protein C8J57DRAFT_1221474 [Mycena rebaudengoi]|nr:hypothetical protein C8J57DRAFT_1221474 [Mycena rebaudengoi]
MPAGREIQQVACLSDSQLEFEDLGWVFLGLPSQVLHSGWTRVISSDIRHRKFTRYFSGPADHEAWLAQANCIIDRAKIPSRCSDYGLINCVHYRLRLSDEDIPCGYLFLCPLQDLQGNSPSEFRYPACPAYWSLDPSGAQRLGSEEAERLGFPSFTLRMIVRTTSWDDLVYTGIREFHQAKGFDPYSQDVARELGYPLFKIRDADLLEHTLNWKVFVGAQLAGIVITTLFSICL